MLNRRATANKLTYTKFLRAMRLPLGGVALEFFVKEVMTPLVLNPVEKQNLLEGIEYLTLRMPLNTVKQITGCPPELKARVE